MQRPSIALSVIAALAAAGTNATTPIAHELRFNPMPPLVPFRVTRGDLFGRDRLNPGNQRQRRKHARSRRSHQLGRRSRCR